MWGQKDKLRVPLLICYICKNRNYRPEDIMFQFNYDLTDDDYVKFNMHYMANSKLIKWTNLILRLFLIFLIVPIIIFFFDYYETMPLSAAALFIFAMLLCLSEIIFYKKITQMYIKLIIRSRKRKHLLHTTKGTLIFEDNFIRDCNPLQEITFSYNLIHKMYMTNEALYLYYNTATAYILPYRFIENQTTFNALIDFLQAKTNKQVIRSEANK